MERREEIDVLKALAIFGVVAIHVGSYYFRLYPQFSPEWNRQVIFDQVLRFCVPLFVALSGYTLALRYKDTALNLGEFFRRRVLRILPLYLLWAGVSFFLGQTGYPFWRAILLGRADYHLYFVPMIIQLYLLFPILLWLVKKWPVFTAVAALAAQTLIFKFWLGGQWSDQQQYIFAGSWIFYFVLGMTGVKFPLIWLAAAVAGLWLTINEAFNILRLPANLIVATRFTKFSVLLYATGIIGLGLTWGKYLNFLAKPLGWIGRNSYLIYLSHVLIVQMYFTGNLLPLPAVVMALVLSIVGKL